MLVLKLLLIHDTILLYFVGQVSQIVTPKFYKEEKHNPLAGKKGEENGVQEKWSTWLTEIQLAVPYSATKYLIPLLHAVYPFP